MLEWLNPARRRVRQKTRVWVPHWTVEVRQRCAETRMPAVLRASPVAALNRRPTSVRKSIIMCLLFRKKKKKNNPHLTSKQMRNSMHKLITRKKAERRVSVSDIQQLKQRTDRLNTLPRPTEIFYNYHAEIQGSTVVEWGLTFHQTHRSYRDGFYGSKDPTNSVKALKEDRVLRIRLQSHQVHPTVLTIVTHRMQYATNTKYERINANKSTHSEMGPVWQNPIQRTVRTAHLSVLVTVQNFSTQYNTEQFW